MTSLQRAAAYLKKIGPTAALAIVPLAAAVPSHASLVLSVTHNEFESTDPSGSGILSAVTVAGSLVQGIHADGVYTIFFLSGAGITVTAQASGGATGTFPNSLTGAWNFNVSDAFSSYNIGYTVTYMVGGVQTIAESGSFTVGASPTNISSFASLNGTPGSPVANWSAAISLTLAASDGDLTFDVQQLDIEAQDVAVPEPSTFLLAAPMVGFLIVRVRRRKR
jgi:hypothetical protein